jgi:hypothetical protein
MDTLNHTLFKASSGFSTNFNDINYLKSKFFIRNKVSYKALELQTNFSAGFIKDLGFTKS